MRLDMSKSYTRGNQSLIKNCKYCSKEFKTFKSQNKKFCSKECGWNFQKKEAEKRKDKLRRPCKTCGIVFVPCRIDIDGIYCSLQCRGKHERYDRVSRGKYWSVRTPEHPNCPSTGYMLEHRLVMEKHLGRFLDREEVVHHINEDGKDNRIENLQLLSDSVHKSYHAKNRNKTIVGRFKRGG
jgi:hypothetical protein